ncbi:hypothetical protein HPB47_006527 [Ixodes persulcatus]|uniref:Uncharacterized protein n=1 Tax=Ixodes persulcatus TaxID=34615 RepID=A0AC60PAN0_IXOPE|nr:hypothetical protein HPB47_006527 [Ixodes persulcatus]
MAATRLKICPPRDVFIAFPSAVDPSLPQEERELRPREGSYSETSPRVGRARRLPHRRADQLTRVNPKNVPVTAIPSPVQGAANTESNLGTAPSTQARGQSGERGPRWHAPYEPIIFMLMPASSAAYRNSNLGNIKGNRKRRLCTHAGGREGPCTLDGARANGARRWIKSVDSVERRKPGVLHAGTRK